MCRRTHRMPSATAVFATSYNLKSKKEPVIADSFINTVICEGFSMRNA
ncbi:MAG: hypothetical protein ACLVME_05245 [Ezakiella coagulans]